MIDRSGHHVLFDKTELMKRIRDPQTLVVLEALQQYYEVRTLRRTYEEMENCETEGVKKMEREHFSDLLKQTRLWLKPPKNDGLPIKKRKLRKVRPA